MKKMFKYLENLSLEKVKEKCVSCRQIFLHRNAAHLTSLKGLSDERSILLYIRVLRKLSLNTITSEEKMCFY